MAEIDIPSVVAHLEGIPQKGRLREQFGSVFESLATGLT
jgi:hypothetical protein